jgi:hypothetical protein
VEIATALERNGPVAVELELVFPDVAVIREGVFIKSSIGSMKPAFEAAIGQVYAARSDLSPNARIRALLLAVEFAVTARIVPDLRGPSRRGALDGIS